MKFKLLAYPLILLTALALAGCGALAKSTPQALPTVVLDGNGAAPAADTAAESTDTPSEEPATVFSGGVTASGKVAPAEQVQLAPALAGSVSAVNVKVGDKVQAGQVLVTLAGGEKLTAAVTAANLDLLAAEQALAELIENAGQDSAAAQLRLANAKDVYDDAEKRRGWKEYRVGDDDQINVARADVIVAEDHLKKTEETYGGFADNPEDNLNKAAALSALSAARKARDKAQANLNYLLSLPNTIEVEKADAELVVARTELEAAQREFERVKTGPDPQDLAMADARIKNAQAQLEASRSALSELEVKAPFDGVVSKLDVHAGAWVQPGQPILVVADLAHLRVETTDLSERDVPRVSPGQAVSVLVKPLNQTITGHVSQIAPLADSLGGDVVYQTMIDLDSLPAGLRAGMSVEVEFGQ